MNKMERDFKFLAGFVIAMFVFSVSLIITDPLSPQQSVDLSEFPDFITKNEDYFITRIRDVPEIDRDSYRLEIRGLVDNRTSFSLDELQSLPLTEMPLTIECIGNPEDGPLIGTAVWKGFNVLEILESLGLSENATGVRYRAADGYYASHTLEQLRNNGVMGALYMNDVEIPPVQGFPLRILNPGYYGVKQPAWVTSIEVIDRPLEDYWDYYGWDTSPPMDIDSHIFFPEHSVTVRVNENLRVGGCAFGGTRVELVEYSTDYGLTWSSASIIQELDADNVWVFWEINLIFTYEVQTTLQVRATDIYGNTQNRTDSDYLDGTTSWPSIIISVVT
jgi:DMSO/TMAO reductase YedYZ molybdopterin-dependent catalytic subunit